MIPTPAEITANIQRSQHVLNAWRELSQALWRLANAVRDGRGDEAEHYASAVRTMAELGEKLGIDIPSDSGTMEGERTKISSAV